MNWTILLHFNGNLLETFYKLSTTTILIYKNHCSCDNIIMQDKFIFSQFYSEIPDWQLQAFASLTLGNHKLYAMQFA